MYMDYNIIRQQPLVHRSPGVWIMVQWSTSLEQLLAWLAIIALLSPILKGLFEMGKAIIELVTAWVEYQREIKK